MERDAGSPGAGMTAAGFGRAVEEQVGRVIVGKADQTRLLIVALLADGHVLLDDVPGVAKTLLVRTLSAALGLAFSRIQCTPDLLPADVTGSLVFDQRSGEFEFRPGPLFANVVLADEINRATPRAQSAFLEAMEERGVTVDGTTHALPQPFTVLATQNPVELKGTFPLPEAQVDRFLLCLRMGYPGAEDEARMLERFRRGDPLAEVRAAVSADDLRAVRASGPRRPRLRRRRRLHRRAREGDARVPAAQARREPARLARAAARRAGRRGARRSRLRDARRRAGVDRAGPRASAAARPRGPGRRSLCGGRPPGSRGRGAGAGRGRRGRTGRVVSRRGSCD